MIICDNLSPYVNYANHTMQNKLLEYLEQLNFDSTHLRDALSEFSTPKEHNLTHFKAGVLSFIRLANMSPEERDTFYGSPYGGLYTNNHLAEVWNTRCDPGTAITAHSLDAIRPAGWDILMESRSGSSLEYVGPQPADALNQLLKGPTVIDCGMYCQLGIWFGIRNILGDVAFNAQFGQHPLLLTRFPYEGPEDDNDKVGNPLFEYFSSENLDNVGIEHVFNYGDYYLKHPGGNLNGQNCLVVDNVYYVFSPLERQSPYNREDIVAKLLACYNAPADQNDADALEMFKENADFFQNRYGSIYEFPNATISWVEFLRESPEFLVLFSRAMNRIPECQEKINEYFVNASEFAGSFYDDDVSENREKYEALYSFTCVKQVFQNELEKDNDLFLEFYLNVLGLFTFYHQMKQQDTISLANYLNTSQPISNIPSYIHFDLQVFLRKLGYAPLSLVISDEESRIYKKAKPTPDASVVEVGLFNHSNSVDTNNSTVTAGVVARDSLTKGGYSSR